MLRNGKGSRDGIEIPERPARYIEERADESFDMPILSTPFYMDHPLEDAPIREKFGQEGGENRSRRRHRSGRRSRSSGGGQPRPPEERQADKKPAGGNAGKPRAPKPPQVKAESPGEGGGEAKRRKPYHRGGRRRGKGGGGAPPKAE